MLLLALWEIRIYIYIGMSLYMYIYVCNKNLTGLKKILQPVIGQTDLCSAVPFGTLQTRLQTPTSPSILIIMMS